MRIALLSLSLLVLSLGQWPVGHLASSRKPAKTPTVTSAKASADKRKNKVKANSLSGTVAILTSLLMEKCNDDFSDEPPPMTPITVFAPSNAALDAAGVDSSDFNTLENIFKNHVIRGEAMRLGPKTARPATFQSWEGFPLEISKPGKSFYVNGVRVARPNSFSSKDAVVHIIDEVLPMPTATSLVQTVLDTPELSTLAAVLQTPAQAQILEALSGSSADGLTLFLPTNEAFAALPPNALSDPELVSEVLKFHVLGAEVFSGDLKPSQTVSALNGGKLVVKKTPDGQVTVNGANVIQPDVKASNGVIHIIDSVMIPLRSIVATAAAEPQLSTLVSILSSPGLEDEKTGLATQGFFNQQPPVWGPFTVFAPTNDAFTSVAADASDLDTVKKVIRYHVIPGDVFSTDLDDSQEIWTIDGETLQIKKENGDVYVNDAKVIVPDIKTNNGVVHVIDSVLIPPSIASPSSASSASGTGSTQEVPLNKLKWEVINDSVMGGVSTSSIKLKKDETGSSYIDFSGLVTTDSNGGFVNAYGRSREGIDLSDCSGLAFMAKSNDDNARTEISLESGERSRMWMQSGATKFANFYPTQEWQEYQIPFSDFQKEDGFGFNGDEKELDLSDIRAFGLRRSAFLNGLTKDPSFRSGQFAVEVKDLRCMGGSVSMQSSQPMPSMPSMPSMSTMPMTMPSMPASSDGSGQNIDVSSMRWEVINDSVMGGISTSSVKKIGDAIKFSGVTTTDSNGGFTNSYGTLPASMDISDCENFSMDVKGDATRYKMTLMSGERSMWGGGSSINANFYPTPEWSTITIPISDFKAEAPGFGPKQPPFDPTDLTTVGINHSAFIGGFQKDTNFVSGPFGIEVKNMRCV